MGGKNVAWDFELPSELAHRLGSGLAKRRLFRLALATNRCCEDYLQGLEETSMTSQRATHYEMVDFDHQYSRSYASNTSIHSPVIIAGQDVKPAKGADPSYE